MKKQSRTKFSDPVIVSRVKNYLAENVDKTFVDVSQMARSLKERYREYNNRSESAFCQMVEAAYKVVLQSYGLDEVSSSDNSDEDSDDLELLDDSNVLNDQLMAMYKMRDKKSNKKERSGQDKTSELIDISSDEDSNTGKAPKQPKLNDQIIPEVSLHLVPSESVQKAKPNSQTNDTEVPKKVEQPQARKAESSTAPGTPDSRKRKPAREPRNKSVAPAEVSSAQMEVSSGGKDTEKSDVTLEDFGGIGPILEQVCELMMRMRHPEVFQRLGVAGAHGALLHGPPGSGKTLLAKALAGSLRLPMLAVTATELVGGLSGESERKIRELFDRAMAMQPCVLMIDDIDAISGDRANAQKDMERRVVTQLLACLDSMGPGVLTLAASCRPEALDPALRRAGRLEQEIALGIPTRVARAQILHLMCRPLSLHASFCLETVARLTPGYVGADLRALINKACALAVRRVLHASKSRTEVSENVENPLTVHPPTSEPETQPAIVIESSIPKPIVEEHKPLNGETTEEHKDVPEKPENAEIEIPQIVDGVADSVYPNAERQNNVEEAETLPPAAEITETNENKIEAVSMQPQIEVCENFEKVDGARMDLKDIEKYLEEIEPYTSEQLSKMCITMEDMMGALKVTRPSAIREGFATVPDTTWEDVGALEDVRRELQLAVLAPVKYPEQLAALGLTTPAGVLLCGPPGCGKTLLAKAVANEAGINFISVKGPELLNMYVGESERAVRTCFQRARNSAPCVIFFDEFDSLCPRRTEGDTGGATRVVNQLLTEMDGVEGREGVFVLAASNRPDIVDPAVLRPGRLDRVLYVGMPRREERAAILRAVTKDGTRPHLGADVDLTSIANAAENYTGADLAGLVRLAATEALTDFITGTLSGSPPLVSGTHFRSALLKMKPSVSPKEQRHYEKLKQKYASPGEDKGDVEMDTTEEWMDTV